MGRAAWILMLVIGGCGGDDGKNPQPGVDAPVQPSGAVCAGNPNTTSPGAAQVTIDLDVASSKSVSPYIYGINNYPENNYYAGYAQTQFGLMRWGGDAYSAYNWKTNAENNGRDNGFTNTNQFMPWAYGSVASDPTYPGDAHDSHMAGAIVDGEDSIGATQARGAAALVTVSVLDYVAANASDQSVAYAPSADFVAQTPADAAAFATFIHAGYAAAPVFYELDNEPNYLSGTHPEVWGTKDLAFDELVRRDVATATAVKAAVPDALVFGPVVAGVDGFTTLDDYGDLASTNPYVTSNVDAISYWLAHVAAADASAGKRLVDVLDLHYYNDAKDKAGTKKSPAECAQGSRDFWDEGYRTVDTTFDDYIPEYKPRKIIPRMMAAIAANDPGTKLAFTEYNNGCEHDPGGGVAEADTLGAFGATGVYAATAWPLDTVAPGTNWLLGAIAAYRNYDGAGAAVGSLAVDAKTTDAATVSAYGYIAPNGATGAQVVAVNRTAAPVAIEVRLTNACALATARAYELSAAHAAPAAVGGAIAIADNAFAYTLPAMSVTTFALSP